MNGGPLPDNGSIEPDDRRWMRRALELAARGRFGASPNPMVGAVVLDAQGKPAGEGWHALYGGPHAEIAALEQAGSRARGGTLYVTLEPCNHHGKTPPCTEAILRAGLSRVVVAQADPNPVAAGGIEKLRREGVRVNQGILAAESERLNRRWLTWLRRGRPWVTLKAATSLDGRIATRAGESKWITGEPARRRGLELREEHDAILVGIGTVLADDPRLTRRLGRNPGSPWYRIVLDSTLRTPPESALVTLSPRSTLIVHTERARPERRRRLEAAGVGLVELPAGASGRPTLQELLPILAALPVSSLLVEGGAEVHGSFVDAGMVDEMILFVAPVILGGNSAPVAIGGKGCAHLAEAYRMDIEDVSRVGSDLEIRAVRRG
ncbi:MAG: bifunctional diaminohydroxyphosphoribosylaminopyrimidine deaminase/5-amino-6-(5-phosphoribosylamino)uracil reductase RibD [Acidobacteria bacterium]|nr:bifunctional diaminohydroxyphosphoribosylaminopyrimidine deaminase/5-amino-6-(5-phosphoribosylamino)uracil reductase RibD [Acidobacteriota bacterium]